MPPTAVEVQVMPQPGAANADAAGKAEKDLESGGAAEMSAARQSKLSLADGERVGHVGVDPPSSR